MKKAWVSTIYSLLIVLTSLVVISCSSEENDSPRDLFYISTDIRIKVTEGIEAVSAHDTEQFQILLEELVARCNSPEMASVSDAQTYMATPEYQNFKEYVLSISPNSYYLLIELFLRGDINISVFNSMFQDMVEASYPGLITQVMDRLEKVTMEEFLIAWPQVCVEMLLIEMEKSK